MKRILLALAFWGLASLGAVAQQRTPAAVNGCQYLTTLPTLVNGQTTVLHCDANGKLLTTSSGGGGSPGGTSGQVQYNNAGAFGGFTVGGDGTLNTATGTLTVTKTNGVAFGAPATASFGTASGNAAQGGVITAGGPTGSATVAPIITYNAAGQLTAVSSATITPAIGSVTGLGTGVATALGNTAGGTGGFALQSGLASYLPLAGGALTGAVTSTTTALATTTTPFFSLINSTASTSGATVQVSPALDFQGHAWNTTSVAADNYVDAQISLTPVSGATPSGSMNFGFRTSIGGSGAFTNILTLNSTGESVLSGNGLFIGAETVLTTAYVQSGEFVAFNNASYIGLGSNQDVRLYRGSAAGLLTLSDSTAPTALYAYASVDTPTGPTNFQRAIFDAGKKTANTVTIGADNGGTGAPMGLNLTVALTTGGGPTTVMGFSSAGLATLPLITSDAGLTDATMCEDTTAHGVYYGSGTLGICLGTSSIRYKHDVTPLDNGLDTIMALNPKRYYLNADHGDPNKPYYGFIAEDCSKAIPELTGLDDLGRPNTCDYVGIIPILVNAIKQQQAEIESLHRFQ